MAAVARVVDGLVLNVPRCSGLVAARGRSTLPVMASEAGRSSKPAGIRGPDEEIRDSVRFRGQGFVSPTKVAPLAYRWRGHLRPSSCMLIPTEVILDDGRHHQRDDTGQCGPPFFLLFLL